MHNFDDLPERERQRQIDEARKLSEQDRHISAPSRKSSISGGGNKLKGHEALLDALKANKTPCEFAFTDGETVEGTVEHLDSSTVSIRVTNGGKTRVIFKASLKYFTPLHQKA